jgi:hypothetical protein
MRTLSASLVVVVLIHVTDTQGFYFSSQKKEKNNERMPNFDSSKPFFPSPFLFPHTEQRPLNKMISLPFFPPMPPPPFFFFMKNDNTQQHDEDTDDHTAKPLSNPEPKSIRQLLIEGDPYLAAILQPQPPLPPPTPLPFLSFFIKKHPQQNPLLEAIKHQHDDISEHKPLSVRKLTGKVASSIEDNKFGTPTFGHEVHHFSVKTPPFHKSIIFSSFNNDKKIENKNNGINIFHDLLTTIKLSNANENKKEMPEVKSPKTKNFKKLHDSETTWNFKEVKPKENFDHGKFIHKKQKTIPKPTNENDDLIRTMEPKPFFMDGFEHHQNDAPLDDAMIKDLLMTMLIFGNFPHAKIPKERNEPETFYKFPSTFENDMNLNNGDEQEHFINFP